MSPRDYYEVLGIERKADEEQIKKAYRKKALEFHPDRNPGNKAAEDKFKEATRAYEILKDPEKRSRYDQLGHAGVDGNFGAPGAGGAEGFDISDALRAFMRDFGGFGDMFGGDFSSARGGGARSGQNLQVRLALTLEEIAAGVTKKIKLKRLATCDVCNGSGARAGSRPATCEECSGTGQVRHVQRSFLGQFVTVTPCRRCQGTGRVVTDPCTNCRGEGRKEISETISVDVPAGVHEGNYIPISGKGHAGTHSGPPGDLIILIEEKPHDVFERHDDDLLCDYPVAYSVVALGGKVEVATLQGTARLEIPAGTQSHQVFRLRGQGMPHLHSSKKGDLLVRVRVWTPAKLNSEQKKLLERLAEGHEAPPKASRRLFERARDAFR